jgi:hypothetical protein
MCSPDILDNIGCIEVVVLRCAGPRTSASSEQTLPSAFSMDGTGDAPEHAFGIDGQAREWDTKPPPDHAELYSAGMKHGLRSQRPSRPSSFYAKTAQSYPASTAAGNLHSQLNDRDDSPSIIERLHTKKAMSPGFTVKKRMSPVGFKYGSGPVPHVPKAESEAELFHYRTPGSIITDAPIVDPKWLEKFVSKAVERKLGEKVVKKKSSRVHKPPQSNEEPRPEVSRPPPGAWPISPFGPLEKSPNLVEITSFGHQPEPSKARTSVSIQNGGPSWGDSNAQWGQQPAKTNIAHVQWANAVEAGAPSWTSAQNETSDSWETSSWGTKAGNPSFQRRKSKLKSRSRWSDPNTPNVPPVSIASLSPHRSVDDWVHINSLSDNSSDYFSTKSDITAVPQPQVISEVKNSLPVRRRKIQVEEPQWGASKNTSDWGTRNDNGWTDGNVEGNMSSSSSTWGPIAPVNPPPPESIAARRNSRSDKQKKKKNKGMKQDAPVPPVPTWGCAVPHKLGTYRVAPARIPPPAYSLEAWMHNISIRSSTPSPWKETEINKGNGSDESDDSWDIGDKIGTWAGNKKNKGQNSWNGVVIGNDSSSYWGDNNKLNDESIQAGVQEASNGWNDDTCGAPNPKIQTHHSGKQTGNIYGWTEEVNNSKEMKYEKLGRGQSSWNTKGDPNDQGSSKPAWYIPELGSKKESNAFVKESWDNTGWNSTPNNEKDRPGGAEWNNIATPWTASAFHSPKTISSHHSTRNSTKSYHPKHQKLRNLSNSGTKDHWKFPPPPSKKLYPIPEDYESITSNGNRKIWTIPEEPLHAIPAAKAEQEMLEHQVRAGKGTRYHHIVGRPKYLDSLEKPYAVFRFKYRSRDVLRDILGAKIVPEEDAVPTAPSPPIEEKLQAMSKEEVVARFMELNNKLKEREGTAAKTPTIVGNWVSDQQVRSRDASQTERKTERKGSVQGWGGLGSVKEVDDDGGWGKADATWGDPVGENSNWGGIEQKRGNGNGGWSGNVQSGGWGGAAPKAPNNGW